MVANKYLIIAAVSVLIALVNCDELYFLPAIGVWDDALNWAPSTNSIPTINDDVYIYSSDGQFCQAIGSDIEASGIQVGSNSIYSMFYSNVSSIINIFIALNQDSQAFFDNGNVVSIGFMLANQSTINVVSNDYSNGVLIVDDNGVFNLANSTFSLKDIIQRNSLISIKNSSGIINIGSNGFINKELSTFNIESSTINIYSDLVQQVSYFNLKDYSFIYFYCVNQKSIHWDPFTIPDGDVIQAIGAYVLIESSYLFIEKVYFNYKNTNYIKSGIATFNNTFTSYNSSFLSNSGIVTFNGPVYLFEESQVVASYGSKVYFNSHVLQFENSSLSFYTSDATIKAQQFNYELKSHSTFIIDQGSTLTIISNFTIYDHVQVKINLSVLLVLGYINCYDSSALATIDSTIYIQNDFALYNSSIIAYSYSNVSISGSQVFNDNSAFAFEYSNVSIDGSFLFLSDNSTATYSSGFFNSLLYVNGLFHNNGYLLIAGSKVNSLNELLLKGRLVIANSTFIIQNGNFYVYGELFSLNSTFILENGYIVLYPNSYFNAKDSLFTLLNGQLLIGSDSTFKFTNSTLLNSNNASISAIGDITLDSNGFIKNNAEMYLYSSILQSKSTTGDENIINQGKLVILNQRDGSGNGSSNISSIMVPLYNIGGAISINDKNLDILQFKQSSAAELNINNSTINSNNSIIIDNSYISGIGLINSTSIEFSNAWIGNNQNNDKIVTILNITGEFKSSKDQINFIIQSEFNSSLINIQNLATINNSTLIIKINQDIPISNKNITLMNFKQMNGNGFGEIKFKYFNPHNGQEKDADPCKSLKANVNSKSITLLIGQDECSSKRLSTGAIIGIVIGSMAFAIVLSVIIKIKSDWFYLKYYTAKEASIKLKSRFNLSKK